MAQSANPVYVITSMGVTGSGTRKMVQAEVALDPAQPFPYGLYATGNTCPSLTFSGGGSTDPATDSFTTANGGTYATTNTPTGGDVGSNGGVSLQGHSQIGGAIGVQSLSPAPPKPCSYAQGDLSLSGSAGPYNPGNAYPGNVANQIPTYTFPAPPDPVPAPPSTPYTGSLTMVPGTYGAISASGGTITLAPGTYNIYSLSMTGKATLVVNPPGAVVLNFPSASANPVDLAGQSIVAANNIANNMQINYGGTGNITLAGQAASYFNVNAPNAQITVSGKGDIYGRIIGQTLTWSGNGKFHFDKNSSLGPPSNGQYRVISFRDVAY
jgi:hypothetical protein